MFNYGIGALNTLFYEQTQNIADHNGWEVLHVIIESRGKPTDNAKLRVDMQLINFI